jgi:molybdopterin converting factor small subunit
MIPPIERKAIVELLVQRKFPPMVLAGLSGKRQPTDTTTLSRILRHEEIKGYRGELEALPENELQELFRTEQAKLIEEAQREEQLRFFHQPHAAADFDHWSKAEHWSLEEAVALAMGKAPEIVSWPKIDSYVQVSPFVQRYRRLRDLAHRAVPWKTLFDPVPPTIFLKWAEDNEIEFPAELREKVHRIKGKATDWRKNYDELRAMYDQHIADWKKLTERQTISIKSLQERISELDTELSELKATPAASQSPIERQNMLKVIYAMAVSGYNYKPTEKRSAVVAEIVGDLNLQGISISDDTVRRYLNEARDSLSEWQDNSR